MLKQIRDCFLHRLSRSASMRFRHYANNADAHLLEAKFKELGLDRTASIPTWTTKAELEALYRLAASCPENANIVEIGSYLGASTSYLAAGAASRNARIICIDTWGNETMPDGLRDTFAEFQRNTAGVSNMITIVRKASRDLQAADVKPPIDLAFIDADHSYEAAKADTAFVLQHMASNGLVVFHDTATFRGVSKAVAEVLVEGDWCIAGHVENMTWLRRATWTTLPPNPQTDSAQV